MDKSQIKNLKPGDCVALKNNPNTVIRSAKDYVICCFVMVNDCGQPVISWPNMNGGCPVLPEEIELVPLEKLTARERRDYDTAVMGMERYYPEALESAWHTVFS